MGTVLLVEKDFEPWLSGSAGLESLKPAANNLRGARTPRKTAAEDSTLIDPVSL
jgi:hypothetical protein